MRLWLTASQLFLHINQTCALFDAPTGCRVEGWRTQSLAADEVKARMMPRTANRVSDKKAVAKWCAIMRAERSDRENFTAATNKQHSFITHVAEQHRSFRDG
jgi:hypothetical protein